MPSTLPEMNLKDLGALLGFMVLLAKLLDVVKIMLLNKYQPSQSAAQRESDPLHIQRTEEIHDRLVNGHVGCHWKDREEVRDFIDAMRNQTVASKAQTQAINSLVDEMRRTRTNGGAR